MKINNPANEIVNRDAPVLRRNALEVPISDIKSAKIQEILSRMKESMATQEDGVAIAAPQIGEPLRIFAVSDKVLDQYRQKTGKEVRLEKTIFINPEIIKLSKRKEFMEEGCLSVRYLYGKVKRSVRCKIKAYDENALPFEIESTGLISQIFQHEVDHLNGTLFIDKAIDVVDLPPKK